MIIIDTLMVTLGFTLTFAAFIGFAYVYKVGRKQLHETLQSLDSINDDLHTLKKQQKVLTSGSIGLGERVIALEKSLRNQKARNNQTHDVDEDDYPYSQALHLIQQGVDMPTVKENSGLSEAEINLMKLMHHHKKNAVLEDA